MDDALAWQLGFVLLVTAFTHVDKVAVGLL
jgi:hypothetical protein